VRETRSKKIGYPPQRLSMEPLACFTPWLGRLIPKVFVGSLYPSLSIDQVRRKVSAMRGRDSVWRREALRCLWNEHDYPSGGFLNKTIADRCAALVRRLLRGTLRLVQKQLDNHMSGKSVGEKPRRGGEGASSTRKRKDHADPF